MPWFGAAGQEGRFLLHGGGDDGRIRIAVCTSGHRRDEVSGRFMVFGAAKVDDGARNGVFASGETLSVKVERRDGTDPQSNSRNLMDALTGEFQSTSMKNKQKSIVIYFDLCDSFPRHRHRTDVLSHRCVDLLRLLSVCGERQEH